MRGTGSVWVRGNSSGSHRQFGCEFGFGCGTQWSSELKSREIRRTSVTGLLDPYLFANFFQTFVHATPFLFSPKVGGDRPWWKKTGLCYARRFSSPPPSRSRIPLQAVEATSVVRVSARPPESRSSSIMYRIQRLTKIKESPRRHRSPDTSSICFQHQMLCLSTRSWRDKPTSITWHHDCNMYHGDNHALFKREANMLAHAASDSCDADKRRKKFSFPGMTKGVRAPLKHGC